MGKKAGPHARHDYMSRRFTRPDLLQSLIMVGASLLIILVILVMGSSRGTLSATAQAAVVDDSAIVEAAKREGKVVFWHDNQEPDVVQFAKRFTDKYGIKIEWERLLPGNALPKLEAGLRSNTFDVDLWWCADAGIMYDQQKKKRILQYVSPQMAQYLPEFKSKPEGYWTAYYVNAGTMMYSLKYVKKNEAPKTYLDLLDPRWKKQIAMRPSTSGMQYAWWYVLRDILPKDYFDNLTKNEPRAYPSSTQQIDDVQRGEQKIGVNVGILQYAKAQRIKQPLELVLPAEGTPSSIEVIGIFASTKRPNAAKLFVDYLLSLEGQKAWNETQGSYSARKDFTNKELPAFDSFKVLTPKDMEDYSSPARHQEFVKIWNQVTGFK